MPNAVPGQKKTCGLKTWMKIYHNIPENKNLFKNPVVTIGNFDGVHKGHQKIFSRLIEIARKKKGDPVVITFSSHPRKVLNPEISIKILTTPGEKSNAIFSHGIDNIIMLHFTREMAEMSAEDFYNQILLQKIDTRHLVIGYDHAFGKGREGNIDFLKKLSASSGIEITRVEEEMLFDRPISSTWLRHEIEDGNIEKANQILGRSYSISGVVVKGMGRGNSLGFPTANISPGEPDKLIPADGVYAVRVILDNSRPSWKGMLNIGNNPTFTNAERTIEVNILDFEENIYDSQVTIEFIKKIRNEIKFNTPEDLVTQLKIDRTNTIKALTK